MPRVVPQEKAPDRPRIARPRGRPPLPASDVAQRRIRIIDAASRMFFANGYTDTTLDAVGREAGVTKRTIYELIGDKSALFNAACNKMRIQGPHFAFNIPVSGRSVREVLKDMARQLVDHSLSDDLVALVRAVMVESTRCPEIVSDVLVDAKNGLLSGIARVFDELVTRGMMAPIDSTAAADIFYDVSVGARGFRAAMGHPNETPSDSEVEQRVDMFLHGYLERRWAADRQS